MFPAGYRAPTKTEADCFKCAKRITLDVPIDAGIQYFPIVPIPNSDRAYCPRDGCGLVISASEYADLDAKRLAIERKVLEQRAAVMV